MKTAVLLFGLFIIASSIASPTSDSRYTPLIRILKELRRRDRYQNLYGKEDDGGNSNFGNLNPGGNTHSSSSGGGSNSNFGGGGSNFGGGNSNFGSSNSNFGNTNSGNSGSASSSDIQVSEFLGQRPQRGQNNYNNNNNNNYNSNRFSSADQIRQIVAQSQRQQGGGGGGGSLAGLGDLGNLPNFPRPGGTSVPPERIEQINRGVGTILGGVRGGIGGLDEILRGSFQFTRNENVRSVANNVLDAIFGKRGGN